MAFVPDAAALVNIASGLLVAGLGAGLLLANPRKDWNRVFALFAVFWGLQVLTLNLVRVTSDLALARLAGELGLAFVVPLYFFLVVFASIFPRPRAPFGTSGLALGLLVLPAAGALAVLFLAPEALIARAVPSPTGASSLRWGVLFPFLSVAPLFGAFFYALWVMRRRLDEAEGRIERKQVAFVLAALALFVAHVVPLELVRFGASALGGLASEAEPLQAGLIAAIMLAGLAVLAELAWALRARLARGGEEGREARMVLGATGLGAGAAMLLWALRAAGLPPIEALGLFRAGAVGLIVYAVARYQLFDIDLRVKAAAPFAATLLGVGALAAAAWLALQRGGALDAPAGALLGAAVLVAFVPLLRLATRLAERVAPGVSPEGEHLYLRKLEVYRASVEGALRDGRGAGPRDPDLAELRRKLGLTERDHQVVALAAARPSPPAQGEVRPGALAFGKYAVESVLGEGGFGRVLLARDTLLGRPVVIKELRPRWRHDPQVARTFLREARIAGQLQHPNIVAVYEVERQGSEHYLVMEYVPGGDLAERLANGSLPRAEAVRVARGVLDALDAAHARGVVHRDVKAGNVLLGARGEVKLADFGIASLDADEPADERTVAGLTTGPGLRGAGTLTSMSPEQARGLPADARSDVYAVGALLHRMLAGEPHVALDGLDELAARNRVAEAPRAPRVRGLDPRLQAALDRALARDPAQRFPTARAFAEALDAASQ